jgi:hypothetical protein
MGHLCTLTVHTRLLMSKAPEENLVLAHREKPIQLPYLLSLADQRASTHSDDKSSPPSPLHSHTHLLWKLPTDTPNNALPNKTYQVSKNIF